MTHEELEAAFAAAGPWVGGFEIAGRWYGGDFRAPDDWERLLWERWPDVRSVLELGCCDGRRTAHLAARAARVVAVEGRPASLARARLAMELLGHTHVAFVDGNLESMDLTPLGTYDAVYLVGLLYHLPEPWALVRRLAGVTSRVMLWTHYCRDADAVAEPVSGVRGRYTLEGDCTHPLSGLSRRSFWPTVAGLQWMFADAGFMLEVYATEPDNANGPALIAFAERTGTEQ